MSISVSLGGPLAAARFLRRPNRFLVRAKLDSGETVDAHLADPGRLEDVLIPERALRLRPAEGRHRKTRWQVVLGVEIPVGAEDRGPEHRGPEHRSSASRTLC